MAFITLGLTASGSVCHSSLSQGNSHLHPKAVIHGRTRNHEIRHINLILQHFIPSTLGKGHLWEIWSHIANIYKG